MYAYQGMNTYGRGDYYRGDPGVFDVLKKIGGAVAGVASRTGIPIVSQVGGIASRLLNGGGRNLPMIAPPVGLAGFGPSGKQGINVPATFPQAVPEPGFKGGLQRFLPGGQSGFAAAPPGYHLNKSYLRFLRAQEMGRPVQNPFNEARAVNLIVRNRKMNPLNPRALIRSTRRQKGMVRVLRGALAGSGYTIQRRGLGGNKRVRRGR